MCWLTSLQNRNYRMILEDPIKCLVCIDLWKSFHFSSGQPMSTLATLQDSKKNTQTLQTIFPVICFGSWARKLAANVRVSALTDWQHEDHDNDEGAILDELFPRCESQIVSGFKCLLHTTFHGNKHSLSSPRWRNRSGKGTKLLLPLCFAEQIISQRTLALDASEPCSSTFNINRKWMPVSHAAIFLTSIGKT